jgi:glycine/D-amino acid oxidase-like deaminating enzyme
MARTDAIVLGAGIVGVSAALHLVKRGLAVALVDRGDPGQGTSASIAGMMLHCGERSAANGPNGSPRSSPRSSPFPCIPGRDRLPLKRLEG